MRPLIFICLSLLLVACSSQKVKEPSSLPANSSIYQSQPSISFSETPKELPVEVLHPDQPVHHTVISAHSSNTNTKPAKVLRPERPKKLLIIGDSHSVGTFGHTLTQLFESYQSTIEVNTIASCGSEPSWWLQAKPVRCGFWQHFPDGHENDYMRGTTPMLTDLMTEIKPDMTVIVLGTNLIPLNASDRRHGVQQMLNVVVNQHHSQCVWVSAPDSRKFSSQNLDEVYQTLAELTSRNDCKLIDSRQYTHYPETGGDGIHYGGSEGKAIAKNWAEAIFQKIKPLL